MAPPEFLRVEVEVEPAVVQLQPLSVIATGPSAAPLSPDGSGGGEGPASTAVAVHAVSAPEARSPAGRVVPEAHGTHAWLATD